MKSKMNTVNKIIIPSIGPWADKGQSAMLISIISAFKELYPNVKIVVSSSFIPLSEKDITNYGKYDVKVLPGIFSTYNNVLIKIKFLKYSFLKAIIAIPLFFLITLLTSIWLFFRVYFKLNLSFLLLGNKEIVREYDDCDWMVVCGGQNITHVSPVLFIALYEILFNQILNKKVMLYAQSLGPFREKYSHPLIKWVLNKTDLITTRENNSKQIIDNLGITAPTYTTADSAFILPSIDLGRAKKILEKDANINSSEKIVGITAIPWHFPKISDRSEKKAKYDNYLKVLADAADYIIEKYNAKIIFFPQVVLPPEKNDIPAAEAAFEKIKNKSNAIVLKKDYTPDELKGMYGSLNMLIGTRFHSCVLALSKDVPIIAIEYDGHKAYGIMKLIGLEKYVYPIENLNIKNIKTEIDSIWANNAEIRKEINEKIKIMQDESKRNVILADKYLN